MKRLDQLRADPDVAVERGVDDESESPIPQTGMNRKTGYSRQRQHIKPRPARLKYPRQEGAQYHDRRDVVIRFGEVLFYIQPIQRRSNDSSECAVGNRISAQR